MSDGLAWLIGAVVAIGLVVLIIKLIVGYLLAHVVLGILVLVALVLAYPAEVVITHIRKDQAAKRQMEREKREGIEAEQFHQNYTRTQLKHAYDETIKRIREITGRDE